MRWSPRVLLTILIGALLATGAGSSGIRAQELIEVADGLFGANFITHSGDGSGRLFVVEQRGIISILYGGQVGASPFLDIEDKVESGGERGLLGLAFHPDFEINRAFYIYYFALDAPRTILAQYRASAQDPDRAESAETVLLEIPQPHGSHNGGMLAFDSDGYLYVSVGDGGPIRDPEGNAQNTGNLLGSILRLGVLPFRIPEDNPFLDDPGVRDEIWAYGFRNPWRFSIDRTTGRFFVGDVGEQSFEEIDLVQAGGNYGWNIMEGNSCFPLETLCDESGLSLPIYAYPHGEGFQAVIGGYVYRGQVMPFLAGRYIFGDFITGRLSTLQETESGDWEVGELLEPGFAISSFGEDESGELYVVAFNRIFRLGLSGFDLAVEKNHSGLFVDREDGHYEIVVRNVGEVASPPVVTILDPLPPGLSLLSSQGEGWVCRGSQNVTCQLNRSLQAGEESRLDLQVSVSAQAVPRVVNRVFLNNPGDIEPANDVAEAPTPVRGAPDLAISKTHDEPFFVPEGEGSYELTVENLGSAPNVTPIAVVDELPVGLRAVEVESDDESWECRSEPREVTCDRIAAIFPGQSSSIEITVRVEPDAPFQVVNRAFVDFDDVVPDNNLALDVTAIGVDSDGDSVPDPVEEGAPDSGDANRHGIPDRLQGNVASFRGETGEYVTLSTLAGLRFSGIAVEDPPSPGDIPDGVDFPAGLLSYQVSGFAAGGGVEIEFLFARGVPLNRYYRFGPTADEPEPHWHDFPFDGSTGARLGTHTLRLNLLDGGRGDSDQQENGLVQVSGGGAFDSAGRRVLYFPQLADGSAGRIGFASSGVFVNTGEDSSLTIDFLQSDGSPMNLDLGELGRDSRFEIPLERGMTLSMKSRGEGGLQGDLLVGYARIESGAGVRGTVVFSRRDRTADVLLYEAGIPASEPLQDLTIPFEVLDGRDTGLALVNPPERIPVQPDPALQARVRLRLYDPSFNLIDESTVSLADGEHLARFASQLFVRDGVAIEQLRGSITLESDRPLAVVVIRQGDRALLEFPDDIATLTAFPVIPSRADQDP